MPYLFLGLWTFHGSFLLCLTCIMFLRWFFLCRRLFHALLRRLHVTTWVSWKRIWIVRLCWITCLNCLCLSLWYGPPLLMLWWWCIVMDNVIVTLWRWTVRVAYYLNSRARVCYGWHAARFCGLKDVLLRTFPPARLRCLWLRFVYCWITVCGVLFFLKLVFCSWRWVVVWIGEFAVLRGSCILRRSHSLKFINLVIVRSLINL